MSIIDAIVDNKDLMIDFWRFLDSPEPLDLLSANYFAKINFVLLSKKTGPVSAAN